MAILLLVCLYAGERAMPCMEIVSIECADECGHERAAASSHDSGHDNGAPLDGDHHCGHCSCPCHIPALTAPAERTGPAFSSSVAYSISTCRLPSASVHPPDHIPLA